MSHARSGYASKLRWAAAAWLGSPPSWTSPSFAASLSSTATPVRSSTILAARAASACPADSPDRLATTIAGHRQCDIPTPQHKHFRDNKMSGQLKGGHQRETHATGVYAPEAPALIDAMGSRRDRSYRLIVEQACVEHPVELATTPVASLQRNPIDSLLTNGAMSGSCVALTARDHFGRARGGCGLPSWDRSTIGAAGHRVHPRRARNSCSRSANRHSQTHEITSSRDKLL